MLRIGFGYDAHRLVSGRPLVLGGVVIPHTAGLAGHSDADVLVHAVMDAFMGALALGDIGQWFPDTDPAYAGANSLTLLERVAALSAEQGYRLNNLDATVVAERPKLAPYIPQMRENIARAGRSPLGVVSVKATTTEGMGFCGTREGIAAYAVAALTADKKPQDL